MTDGWIKKVEVEWKTKCSKHKEIWLLAYKQDVIQQTVLSDSS